MTNWAIADFISHLNHLDVKLSLDPDSTVASNQTRLRCNAPEGTLTPALRQELTDRKAELITYLQKNSDGREPQLEGSLSSTPPPSHPSTPSPLSFAQQRLWFLYQLAPHNPFYNVPAAIRLTGTLDRSALERSLQEIVRRHAALRTRFTTVDGQPVQVVEPNANVELAVVNLQSVAIGERDRIRQQLATAEAQRPFDLTTDSLLRVTLLHFDAAESVLLLTMHHIVADGWSLGILIKELGYFYTAFVEERSPALPPLPIQYADFARWQHNWLQGEVLEKQLSYWRQQLQDLPVLELPSDRPRPAVQTYQGATYPVHISPTLSQALETFSQQSGASLFMTLLAAFQTLLYRYTGQEDIAIGSPIANRHRSEVEGLIGFFVNSLVMRSNLSGNPTFRELLEQVRQVALGAYEHQDLPFEKLVEELDPDRDLSRNPLFQVAFALQNAPMQPLELPALTLEPAPLESASTRFDLEVHLWEPAHGLKSFWRSQDGLGGFISYSTDLFDRDRIARLVGHFQTLLEGIVANPDARLSDLPLLTSEECQQILHDWSGCSFDRSPLALADNGEIESAAEVPLQGQTGIETSLTKEPIHFHHIVEVHAKQAPKAIALVTESQTLTYQELDQQAEHLAGILKHMGVQPNSLVGLCVDRSADMVIGILGILKAGGAYVPLDSTYPSDRLQFILDDTQVSILLTQSWLAASLPTSHAQIVCLECPHPPTPFPKQGEGEQEKGESLKLEETFLVRSPLSQWRERELGGEGSPDLAYVIYTSGSTGTPKGVLLSHRGLCNVVQAQQQVFQPTRTSRVLQFSSLSFDASIFEIALALGSGGTLYIPPKSAQLPGMALMQFLQENAITHALLTPAVLAVLPLGELPNLQVLITGGEACSNQVIDRWAANCRFFNAYGPTETTIWATVAELQPGDNPLTIGRPIFNTQVYVLDANLNPVPAGIPGELYIGGAGVAQGYLNRPELTVERFINTDLKSTFSTPNKQQTTLYKTGDRVLYNRDGTIQFLGRVDHQIKIRGFRVELGEIETILQRHPAIQDAVVIPSAASSLIAYFSLDTEYLQETSVRSLQAQHLEQWQTLYNQTYQSTEPTQPLTSSPQHFDITGWNSSYTGDPIPLEQMQEWVSDRVQQILALKPKRVLEIGCGTGLLLFQIAPHCQQYVGTDFSAVSLASVQTQLDTLNLSQVELLHRTATDFEEIDLASFDVVILNSVVQYFPSEAYLMQVLEKTIEAVAEGGVLFVGDVRNLSLLPAFHSWMKFVQADASVERSQLWHQVERSQFEEPELAIDPAFFYALRSQFTQIQQVHIRLTRGCSQNEMTQFRYNVLLRMGQSCDVDFRHETQPTPAIKGNQREQLNWKHHPMTVQEIQQQLLATKPEILSITNVSNSRVNAAVATANWLQNKKAPKTVGRMRELLQNTENLAIDPQDWWNLETTLPYTVEITWSASSETGDYDVVLIRHGVNAAEDVLPRNERSPQQFTNYPLQANVARHLISELRQHLSQALPDYMVPAAFVPLATLPLNSSGKVDRRALPPLDHAQHNDSPLADRPQTSTETALIEIWQELLQLKHINRHDNFFELGGHSLLATQMTSRIRDTFKLELPLKNVFAAPTIAQLAPILDALRDTTPSTPPLVRLDRTAYRRKQSTLLSQPSQVIPAPPQQETLEHNEPVTPPPTSPLVPLTLGGSEPPFFCVHPMFGVVFPYLELAHYLKSDRSFYGLQPLGLDGKSPPLNRMEAIAAYYIQAIQTLQPHGPYYLGGWSFGGLVAFEMAQQLTQAGEKVELLAILDTTAPCTKPSFCQSLKFLVKTALWSTLPFLLDIGALATHRLHSKNPWFSRWQWSAITRLIPEESRLRLLDESAVNAMLPIVYANSQATYDYVPQPYSQAIALFKAAEQSDANRHDQTLGWSELVENIQLHEVPGNHLSLLKQPHVQVLAQQLRHYLI
ncbi:MULTISPECIES: non-ribosomal peptide synthetase [Cyanophyceae]|uniref:non-ribosomal peptide synthetase n=1 Tax=Cyanophyceae TaxID=3028117 RepID=UPI001683ABCA|nr:MULTISPECIES: non-ribosomal peptide synthetase [Cyanophyceae]MBD1918089.1 amino acid adenylation domain-containing protein [Phormidium sp. FACHB-77]MBD2030121.1 amino acid adenylation domain-containing protein [Phormidium sp. FACHB-322]MBD2051507.1 amino acid adenylation domain-containing protein [Leptolyngbya sp. FACHB-60]